MKKNLLRDEDVRGWLVPLARLAATPFALVGADGAVLLGEGTLDGPSERWLVLVHGEMIAAIDVPAGHPAGPVLRDALAAFAETRFSLNDFSRSLATAWKESNFLSDLTGLLQDVVVVDEAARVIVLQLARVQRAELVALALDQGLGWEMVASHPPAPAELAGWAETFALAGLQEPAVFAEGDGCLVYFPLLDGARVLGGLLLRGPASIALSSNLKFLGNVGAQIAQAVRLRVLIQQEIGAAALRRDLELGAEIQRGFLPQSAPAFSGVAVSAVCRPAQVVGGDGYDYHVHEAGLDVIIADVSGHGVAAGLLMSSFFGSLRALDLAARTPADLAAMANRRICREVGDSGRFVTAQYARLHPGARRLTYAGLGHPAPLLRRDGRVMALPAPGGLAAGMADAAVYVERELALEPGDVLLFYTDGFTEARSSAGLMLGDGGLAQALLTAGDGDADSVLAAVIATCDAYSPARPPQDDQTAIVLVVLQEDT